jgi:transcription elongation factor Elf1
MLTHTAMDYDERFGQEDSSIIAIKALKKIFEDRPVKSTLTLNYKCSVCGKDISIDITHTSGGFGLNGAFFLDYASDKYLVKCRDCYNRTSVHP